MAEVGKPKLKYARKPKDYQFSACFFAMGLASQATLDAYWSPSNPQGTPFYRERMGKQRWHVLDRESRKMCSL